VPTISPVERWEASLIPRRYPRRAEDTITAPEDVSERATKVYDAMKSAGLTAEDKMRDAEAITKMSRLPKNMVLQALQELQSKGYVKRRAREKAAGYYVVK
jgi:DNA-binding IclR family transcriptional regulator